MNTHISINQVCLRTKELEQANSIKTYYQLNGYDSWKNIVENEVDRQEIIATIKQSGLRGRGGAGFSLAAKLGAINYYDIRKKYLVVNADEGEPGTFKDRDILTDNPHQLIEGICIAAYAIGAETVYVYIRGEFYEPSKNFEAALVEAYQNRLLGENIGGFGINLKIHTFYGAGGYICGEETALLESLEGKKPFPRSKPPYPTERGFYGCPTVVINVETLATVPLIFKLGASWHAEVGTALHTGYKIFSISGHVNKPGNYEVPLGTPFYVLLNLAGGMKHDKKLKAVIPGGTSAPILPAEIILPINMDHESLVQAGSILGSGGIIVMDEDTSMVQVLERLAYFYFRESCGQCTPCREGTGWIYRIVQRILAGKGNKQDLETLQKIANNIGDKTICVFAESLARPVLNFIKYFKNEFLVLCEG